jgi:carboxyl-terminal processing protease
MTQNDFEPRDQPARSRPPRAFMSGVLAAVLIVVGVFGGVVLDREVLLDYVPSASASTAGAGLNTGLINQAWNIIRRNYADQPAVQSQALTYGAIGGMVDALGDTGHSRFLTPEMLKNENEFTQGSFQGVGIEVQVKNGNVVVVAPIDDSPAQRAGVRPGEIIAQVNGQDVTGLPLEKVIPMILGSAGTKVTITFRDPDTGKTRDIELTRAQIKVRNVTWAVVPGTTIAHVRLAAYSQGVSADLRKALQDIQQQGLTGIVLDLRNDPGGLLGEAVGVTSEFLKDGNVLLERDAQGKTTAVPVQPNAKVTDLPMVVLINQGTASAAEITAGALQDSHRATLEGETTFGTGTVLLTFGLSDGSALLLATQEWLTPGGQSIWHHGITPTVQVTMTNTAAPLEPQAERSMSVSQLQSSGDAQLMRALTLLHASPR